MTMNNGTPENPCTCGPSTDVKCLSCLTGEMEDLRNDVDSLRKDVDDADLDSVMTESAVERAIEEAFSEFERDNEMVTERDVEDAIERATSELTESRDFNDLEGTVEELTAQVQALQTMIETLHARTLRARLHRALAYLRSLRVVVRVNALLHSGR